MKIKQLAIGTLPALPKDMSSAAKTRQLERANRCESLTEAEVLDSTRAYAYELACQLKSRFDSERISYAQSWDRPSLSGEVTRGYRH